MTIKLNHRINKIIGSVVFISLFLGNVLVVKATETYKEDGMEFTVGRHKPTERVNPKKEEGVIIQQTVVVDSDVNELPGIESDGKDLNSLTKNVEALDKENEGDNSQSSFSSIIKEILESIKKIWNKITTFEEETEGRLSTIESKLQEEESNQQASQNNEIEIDGTATNIEDLTELTTEIMEELQDQNSRIDELEGQEQSVERQESSME